MRKTESREEQTSDSWNASNENERKGEESFIQMGFFRHCRSFHSCFEALQFPPRTLRIQEAASWELKETLFSARRAWGHASAGAVGLSCSLLCLEMMSTASSSFFQQNVDLPCDTSATKKKPFIRPLKDVIKKLKKDSGESLLQPPANGLLIPELVPVAHETFKARVVLVKGVQTLLKTFPVKACRYCPEVHVGPSGHLIASCQGRDNGLRHGRHDWMDGGIQDVLPSMEVFHLSDRLGKVITHEDRFGIDRLPAVVELCIQAGVDVPGYPTKRRSKPVVRIGKKPMDFDDLDSELSPGMWKPRVEMPKKYTDVAFDSVRPHASDICSLDGEEFASVAARTLQAWNTTRKGARRLMAKYSVHVCGYCPELHVGPKGTKTKDCLAFKHQMRAGHHGWQDASFDDLIPPKYVWHLRDPCGPPLATELRVFYGVTPAVVELCVQAGAAVPERYRPMMRLDVVIPDLDEVHKVA